MTRGLVFIGFSLCFPALGWGVYERPFTSNQHFGVDLERVEKSQFLSHSNLFQRKVSNRTVRKTVRDPQKRVSKEFRVPPGLENSVEFWMKIYTRHTTRHVTIYDRCHPEIVYETLDFRDLYENSRSRLVYEILRERKIKRKISAYKKAFRNLTRKKRTGSVEERHIRQALRKAGRLRYLKTHARQMRTQTGQRDAIIRGLWAAKDYMPVIEGKFRDNDLPIELINLSLLESSFNLNAVSHAGASGVWQFMPASAKEFMIVKDDGHIDERRSVLKSTDAAIRLIKRNQRLLKNWGLSITAYNYGPRKLLKVPSRFKRRSRIAKVFQPCKNSFGLKTAGVNYYPGLLALIHATAYHEWFYDGAELESEGISIVYQKLPQPISALNFALENALSLKELQDLNPDIRNPNLKLPKGYRIAIPQS